MKSSQALLDRLVRLADEGATCVTPNQRLAATLKRLVDDAHIARGKRAWASPDIIPLATFFARSHSQLSRRASTKTPLLIQPAEALVLWERIISESENAEALALLSIPQAAKEANTAWTLMHSWDLAAAMARYEIKGLLNEDCRAFWGWAARYRTLCADKKLIDSAALPDYLRDCLHNDADAALPRSIILAGFDIVTPQQQHFFDGCIARGILVETLGADDAVDSNVTRHTFTTDEDELRTAAAWARERLTLHYDKHIAIVVPDLRAKRSQIQRILTDTMTPLQRASTNAAQPAVFNISLGLPLSDYALVHDALALLDFSLTRAMPTLTFSALLRSAFTAGAMHEIASRTKLDAVFREMLGVETSLFDIQKLSRTTQHEKLMRAIAACPQFFAALNNVAQIATPTTGRAKQGAAASVWCDYFSAVLSAWGFPGDQSSDSHQFQVLAKFRDVLLQFATLERVTAQLRPAQALAQLRRMLSETIFQPESNAAGEAPIQVLGILESAGHVAAAFDALWVTGLHVDAWPLAARPSPFIPSALQREAGVPESSANASHALDRKITAGWRRSAATVVFSHAMHERDAAEQARQTSALITDVALSAAPTFAPNIAEILLSRTVLESIPDVTLALLGAPTTLAGGASIMADVAACPFRAFARHRLRAQPLLTPARGLDAAERGTLLHAVLNLVWQQLKSQTTLLEMPPDALEPLIAGCVARAIDEARAAGTSNLRGRFAEIEAARLTRIVNEWLVIERARTPFNVVATEAAREISIAGLKMKLRLDRMDQLQDGTHALIDYKTGVADYRSWLGERPDEPQLPLYYRAVEANGDIVSTLAFARLKRGKAFGFDGVSAVADMLPSVTPIEDKHGREAEAYASWDVLTQSWETTLDQLATQFAHGDTKVAPKNGALTCQRCDLQGVCRVSSLATNTFEDDDV